MSWGDLETDQAALSPGFHTHRREGYEIREQDRLNAGRINFD
jgi:hypothetical protein